MAKAKSNKKMESVGMDTPECPICFEALSLPIYQCLSGHSFCHECTANLSKEAQPCPMCRQSMTLTRNWTLEALIAKAKVHCPNRGVGCVYTMSKLSVEEHLKDCIFRNRICPLGEVFGRCSWTGQLKNILEHFKVCHPQYCNVSLDTDFELEPVSIMEDDRHFFLLEQYKQLFIITARIDTIQKVAYWVVQHIGSKKIARQHIYEVHIISNLENRRKVMFFDYCCSESMKVDEIVHEGKCGIMPLSLLSHFIEDKKLTFRLAIRKANQSNPDLKKGDESNVDQFNQNSGPSDSRPHVPSDQSLEPPWPRPNMVLRRPGCRGTISRGRGERVTRARRPERPRSSGSGPSGQGQRTSYN